MIGDDHPLGFTAPLHRALIEPILLAGVPRSVALVNGTVAAAIGLGLQQWIAGLGIWIVGHTLAALASRHDTDFVTVLARHLRQKGYWRC